MEFYRKNLSFKSKFLNYFFHYLLLIPLSFLEGLWERLDTSATIKFRYVLTPQYYSCFLYGLLYQKNSLPRIRFRDITLPIVAIVANLAFSLIVSIIWNESIVLLPGFGWCSPHRPLSQNR